MSITLSEIASLVQGRLIGDPAVEISGVSDLQKISPGTLVFAFDEKNWGQAKNSSAAAIVAGFQVETSSKPVIIVENPRLAQAKILTFFRPAEKLQDDRGKAWIHPTAIINKGVVLSPFCYIGEGVIIGENTTLYPGVHIGPHSKVGKDCILYPNVVLRERTIIGDRVILESGVAIGSDGFGYQQNGDRRIKVPQVGNVLIEDEVEIGANSTVDRATMGTTHIKKGTKIDNLVHIAHNCVIGENCVVVAGTGISGSVEIGDRVTIAGQVGTVGHITIGSDSVVLGKSGVTKDIPPGSFVSGFPAKPHREELKIQALVEKLPLLIQRIKQLEDKLGEEGK